MGGSGNGALRLAAHDDGMQPGWRALATETAAPDAAGMDSHCVLNTRSH
jgi:hypothetical protein